LTNSFYRQLERIGIADTRIPSLIAALNNLHSALVQLDDLAIQKLREEFGSLDCFFRASQGHSKKISLEKHPTRDFFKKKIIVLACKQCSPKIMDSALCSGCSKLAERLK